MSILLLVVVLLVVAIVLSRLTWASLGERRSIQHHEQATRLWAQVEGETVAAAPRPLSMVRVTAGGAEVGAAVRGALRSTDTVGRAPDGSLIVLLPDVDEAGAAVVAARLTRAVAGVEPGARVVPVSRGPAEEPVELLERSLPEVTPRHG